MNALMKEDYKNIVSDTNVPWEKLRGQTVLITGATGLIGEYLVGALVALNQLQLSNTIKIIALCRSKEKAHMKFSEWISDHLIDCIYQDVCETLSFDEKIDYIIHAASPASSDGYKTSPVGVIDANVVGTRNLLQLAKEHHSQSLLFISSGEVYGENPAEHMITEDSYGYVDIMQTRSCYAESKRLGENMCVAWSYQYGVQTKIARLFHTYGPSMSLQDCRSFADFVEKVIHGKQIVIHSDGLCKRPFCYVSDAIVGLYLVLLKGAPRQAYNVANPDQHVSIMELAHTLVNLYPEKGSKVITHLDSKLDDEFRSPLIGSIPDITKIRNLNWNPRMDIKTGFKRTIEALS